MPKQELQHSKKRSTRYKRTKIQANKKDIIIYRVRGSDCRILWYLFVDKDSIRAKYGAPWLQIFSLVSIMTCHHTRIYADLRWVRSIWGPLQIFASFRYFITASLTALVIEIEENALSMICRRQSHYYEIIEA